MKIVYRAVSRAVPTIHSDFHWHAGILLAGTDGFEDWKKKSLIFTYYHESLGHYKFLKSFTTFVNDNNKSLKYEHGVLYIDALE